MVVVDIGYERRLHLSNGDIEPSTVGR